MRGNGRQARLDGGGHSAQQSKRQTEPVKTATNVMIREGVSDDVAYTVTKTIIRNAAKLRQIHAGHPTRTPSPQHSGYGSEDRRSPHKHPQTLVKRANGCLWAGRSLRSILVRQPESLQSSRDAPDGGIDISNPSEKEVHGTTRVT